MDGVREGGDGKGVIEGGGGDGKGMVEGGLMVGIRAG